jgi:uncharacterized membrane protein
MPHCPHCGQEILETASFCPACGQAAPKLPSVSQTAVRRTTRPLPLREYLKTGWELFKRYPGGFIGFTLLYFLIQIALGIIPYVGDLASLAVFMPLMMGTFIVSAKLLQGRSPQFGDFFLGFRFFFPLLLTVLVGWLLIFLTPFVVGLLAVNFVHLVGRAFLKTFVARLLIVIGALLMAIPAVYLAVSYCFAASLVVDRRLAFWPALELSRGTVNPIWFGMFGFFLLLELVNLLGVIALFVGLLVSLPVSCCALTAAYADIFGWQSDYSEGFPDNLAPAPEISAQ